MLPGPVSVTPELVTHLERGRGAGAQGDEAEGEDEGSNSLMTAHRTPWVMRPNMRNGRWFPRYFFPVSSRRTTAAPAASAVISG